MAQSDTKFRFNGRVYPIHMAFLGDQNRNASGLVRGLIDSAIEDSKYDYQRLQKAANLVAQEVPREEFTDMNRTEDIIQRAKEIDEDFADNEELIEQ